MPNQSKWLDGKHQVFVSEEGQSEMDTVSSKWEKALINIKSKCK